MAYIYGSGKSMAETMLHDQHLLVLSFQEGFTVHRILWAEEPSDYNHFGIVTQSGNANSDIGPGEGWDYTIPRYVGSENDNQVFDIQSHEEDVIWQVMWSMPSQQRGLRIYTAIPEEWPGRTLDNTVGGNTFSVSADRYWGWTFECRDSQIWQETDSGSWFHLPKMQVAFAGFNPPGGRTINDPVLRWKIRRLWHRPLRPHESRRDAQIALKCLRNEIRCTKWQPIKGPMDWGNFRLWNTKPIVWNGEDGLVDKASLISLAGGD